MLAQHDYNIRHNNIRFNNLRLDRSRSGVTYHCIKVYNVIPSRLRALPPQVLLKVMRNHLVQNAFYSMEEYMSSNFDELDK